MVLKAQPSSRAKETGPPLVLFVVNVPDIDCSSRFHFTSVPVVVEVPHKYLCDEISDGELWDFGNVNVLSAPLWRVFIEMASDFGLESDGYDWPAK
jgi:hypothetical protein